jgi:methyl-accepting chemotaxis protein
MRGIRQSLSRLFAIFVVVGLSSFAGSLVSATQTSKTGGTPPSSQPSARERGEGERRPPAFTVDGQVALRSFMALSDAHLKKLADLFHLLAATDDARSGDWERIRGPLAGVAPMTVPAVLWFARPDGSYWTVTEGRAGNLSDRAYFPRVLAGQTVVGDLVVSRSTNRNTAIVAVPVRGRDGAVVGVLGGSVHLDRLGALVREEMGGLTDLLFFAIDSTPKGALHSDPTLIFTEPMRLGDEGMQRAFTEILSRPEGTVTYTFRGRPRTVLYRKSPVTHWWYAIGLQK